MQKLSSTKVTFQDTKLTCQQGKLNLRVNMKNAPVNIHNESVNIHGSRVNMQTLMSRIKKIPVIKFACVHVKTNVSKYKTHTLQA